MSTTSKKPLLPSVITDSSLAPSGYNKINWAGQHMPVMSMLRQQLEQEKPLQGLRIAMCMHLEAKTAFLAQTMQAAGGEIIVAGSNPLSTQDDVVAALVDSGVTAFAKYGCSMEEYEKAIEMLLDCEPDAIIDDGGDVVGTLHKHRPEQAKKIIGGCEETTTGILRLKTMDQEGVLLFPMVAVNDAYMKYLFDNRYGTGQSVWDGIMRTTNLVVAGKNVVVIGYGWCGKGVAMRAKGMGARVIVTEINPIKANEAWMDGYEVMPMSDAARLGDVFITVTGNINVIRGEHLALMKDNALLANAGHFDVEISKPDLAAMAVSSSIIRKNIEEFVMPDGRRLHLIAEGRLVNLAAGDGHPAEVMDLSFSLQALSLLHVIKNRSQLENHVYNVPGEIDELVALMRLKAIGVNIDSLTSEQKAYLADWEV